MDNDAEINIASEVDIVAARQKGRSLAVHLGFTGSDVTMIATAISEIARNIVDHAKRTNARVCGPIPVPTRIERYTVLRSPHIDKKSREQFEMRTHKRVIDIFEPTARTVEALNRLVVPAGVFVKIKA